MNEQFLSSVPHGGKLIDRTVNADCRAELAIEAESLPSVRLSPLHLADLDMIACGAFSPLTGFQPSEDYHAVIRSLRLADGTPWTIPIVLDVPGEAASGLEPNSWIALIDDTGTPMAVMELEEKYPRDKLLEAGEVFGTEDGKHPGVARIYSGGDVLLAGPVHVLERQRHTPFDHLRLDPAQTRGEFARRGWHTVVGFQTCNLIHRAHEYMQKCALELVDGLLIHSLIGPPAGAIEGEVPAEVRVRSYEEIIRRYYPCGRVILSLFPATIRQAGPREAVLHAICSRNYGCTHFLIGRNRAGIGDHYGPGDTQRVFDVFEPDELGIVPMKFEEAFYCTVCGGMASGKTCPHDPARHVIFSGRRIREMISRNEPLPAELIRPEAAAILVEAGRI